MKHHLLNPVMEESLRQQIDRWLEQRVVEEADSPWSFPLVPVPKKNNKEICWAVDYRRLNAVMKKDAFSLPNIADNLSRLSGGHIFSALDGAGAFHAIPDCRADREKTAFSSPFASTNLSRCPSDLPLLQPLTPIWLRRLSGTCLLLKSFAIWTIQPSTRPTLGATSGSSGRFWPHSAPPAFKYHPKRLSCSRMASSTWDMRSVPGASAFPRNTRLSSLTGQFQTPSRPYEPSSGNAGITADSLRIMPASLLRWSSILSRTNTKESHIFTWTQPP